MRKTMALFLALSGLLTAGGRIGGKSVLHGQHACFDRAEYGVFGSD